MTAALAAPIQEAIRSSEASDGTLNSGCTKLRVSSPANSISPLSVKNGSKKLMPMARASTVRIMGMTFCPTSGPMMKSGPTWK